MAQEVNDKKFYMTLAVAAFIAIGAVYAVSSMKNNKKPETTDEIVKA